MRRMQVMQLSSTTGIDGRQAQIGVKNMTKGIPYYQAKLNELVRVFSRSA
ncbi:MAG: hypothetical protein ACLUGQ_02015 [Coprococcus sp.]